MKEFLTTCLTALLLVLNSNPLMADAQTSELPECVVVTHCVLETWEVSDVEVSFEKAVEAVTNSPRTKIIEKNDSYVHAEAKTKWRRYTDDLLVKALPERGMIQVRSESRVGVGDNGVNKKRVDKLAYRLMKNQTAY